METERRLSRLTVSSLLVALVLSVLAGFLYTTSFLLGISITLVSLLVIYLNLPMLLTLRQISIARRPLPRLVMMFWVMFFKITGLPQAALVYINNRVTGNLAVKPQEAHVLVSRCLQYSGCANRVTVDISNCRECGKCKIGAIKRVCEDKGLSATVESGGTSARLSLKQIRPRVVVAVACEREILAGILDTTIPVVGVMIKQGLKPCTDSDLAVDEFNKHVNCIVKED